MIEIPEAVVIADQITNTIKGNKIVNVVAAHTPHKFTWFYKEPKRYKELLEGKTIDEATAYAGMIEIKVNSSKILIGDGAAPRYHKQGEKQPIKHQLLLELDNRSAVSVSVQMYGGIWCFDEEDDFNNIYYKIAKEKPSPLTEEFNETYFEILTSQEKFKKLSVKAFLATEQRIPGLGNGVLQDILWKAKINPKQKMHTLTDKSKYGLFKSIKIVLSDMTSQGGRNTEKDFFGINGDYKTIMSKNYIGSCCPDCGGIIIKENYLGGSIYYCERCQKI
ncbi:hypothetical protein KQI42_12025 [Tissierella sp. MSJ-40]|uniref:Formamidopyrimidine-DNA glycosylase H2TH DNA-binding domain-containing protein n=1 Tax=Tissierella simiarum TaxID=2841534 RepID=A0ABS6E8I9_9FIRM|nr:hypothetical protein [Tissierella simiarum]